MDKACISELLAKQYPDGKVCVRIKTHYGHGVEIQHTHISKVERASIAAKLISGVSKVKILDQNRSNTENEIKRIDLLTKKDIDHIQKSFKLEVVEGIRHECDATSVDLWVEDMRLNHSETNPVLFYKKQNEEVSHFNNCDFCLIIMNDYQKEMLLKFGSNIICIDSTHGLNNYDFEMTTLMVVDNFGEGFPVSYMFTNRKDTQIHKHFFEIIKSKVGAVEAKTFMSDITLVFYNAWICTMGSVTHQLYCAWHIDRAWQSNLTKINAKSKRDEVYKTLKVIQNNVNVETFLHQLNVFLAKLLQGPDTQSFGIYFKQNYMHTTQQWALCFRRKCGINTNMRVESLHKNIKYLYLDKKNVKGLDKGLHAVMKYTRDKIFDRMIKITKGKHSYSHKQIMDRHRIAAASSFSIVEECNNKWKVGSSENEYFVEKLLSSKCCDQACNFCGICIHMFACDCPDSVIKCSICKHIHYVLLKTDFINMPNLTPVVQSYNETLKSDVYENEIKQCLLNLASTKNAKKGLKDEIELRLDNLPANLGQKNDMVLKQLNSVLKSAEALLNVPITDYFIPATTGKLNAKKNITPQKRFFSTKRKRKTNTRLSKPNPEEVVVIQNILEDKPVLFISNEPANDHCYV